MYDQYVPREVDFKLGRESWIFPHKYIQIVWKTEQKIKYTRHAHEMRK